ncbi:hypothetical protein K1T34_40585 [Amycolatopsis sp. DSM 110486]|nr:hypothetical protein [Amycolatopsis sp. DSM 110486]QYN18930.1 hypothetical protein K1T34_40585 [Amycolatopsis sp. DSM 110486]
MALGNPQLFFYDDFLGEITLDHHLGKNEDRRLLGILSRIRKTPGKLLVLATREYVLREAKHRHEILGDGDLEPLTCNVGARLQRHVLPMPGTDPDPRVAGPPHAPAHDLSARGTVEGRPEPVDRRPVRPPENRPNSQPADPSSADVATHSFKA